MTKFNVFLILLLFLLMTISVNAQVHVGVIGGVNLASVNLDPLEGGVEISNLTVFGIGGVIDYEFNESMALRFEPMYIQKGAKGSWNIFEMEDKLSYIEIPILLKYSIGKGKIKPYLEAGPYIGFLLAGTGKVSGGGYSEEEDIKDATKSLDFGLGFGAGVSVPVSKNYIFLEARYALGLVNINEDPDDPDTEVKTKGIQVFVGMTFPL